jgi:hypothetical protein
MPKIAPKRVKKQVGLNPIAQAVARENMRKTILDQKIQLYTTHEGESCVEFCVPMFTLFLALLETAKVDPKVGTDNYEVRIMRGTLSALEQMIADNSYRRMNIVSLETGLDCAQALVAKINPVLFNQEWNKLAGGV